MIQHLPAAPQNSGAFRCLSPPSDRWTRAFGPQPPLPEVSGTTSVFDLLLPPAKVEAFCFRKGKHPKVWKRGEQIWVR